MEKTCFVEVLVVVVSMEELMKNKEKMSVDSHANCSMRGHNRVKDDAQPNGIRKKTSDDEYAREVIDIMLYLDWLKELLQKNEEEQYSRKKKLK